MRNHNLFFQLVFGAVLAFGSFNVMASDDFRTITFSDGTSVTITSTEQNFFSGSGDLSFVSRGDRPAGFQKADLKAVQDGCAWHASHRQGRVVHTFGRSIMISIGAGAGAGLASSLAFGDNAKPEKQAVYAGVATLAFLIFDKIFGSGDIQEYRQMECARSVLLLHSSTGVLPTP